MGLKDLTTLLYEGKRRKYRSFLFCLSMTIALLFSLRLLSDNRSFQDPSVVDPLISSNAFAPTLFLYLFSAFFIPYTCLLLNRQIGADYGILLALGLTKKQMLRCVLFEHVRTFLAACVGGVCIGNLLYVLILALLRYAIGLSGIAFDEGLSSLLSPCLYLFFLYGASLAVSFFSLFKKDVLTVMRQEHRSERIRSSVVSFYLGLVLAVFSLAAAVFTYESTQGNSLLTGILFSYAGLFLMIRHSDFIIRRRRGKALLLISDHMYYRKRNIRLALAFTALYGVMLFVLILSVISGKSLKNNVYQYHPYDLVYTQFADREKFDMEAEVKACGIEITLEREIPFFYSASYAVFDVDTVNAETGKDFQVSEGKFLFVRNIVPDDGYAHEKGFLPSQAELADGVTVTFESDRDCLLFCRGGGLTDDVLLVSRKDFESVEKEFPDRIHMLRLYRFSQAEKTAELAKKAEIESGSPVSSFHEAYVQARQSFQVLIFLMSYILTVFLLCVFISTGYKLSMEKEADRSRYKTLLCLGADRKLIERLQSEKIKSIVLWPYYAAVIWMLPVSFSMVLFYRKPLVILICFAVISASLWSILFCICTGMAAFTNMLKEENL